MPALKSFDESKTSDIHDGTQLDLTPVDSPSAKKGLKIGEADVDRENRTIAEEEDPTPEDTDSYLDGWRLNVLNVAGPGAAIALVLTVIGMPSNFPNHKEQPTYSLKATFTRENFRRVDLNGLLLLLGISILIVTALEEGGTQYSWHSAVTLALLLVGVALFFLFLAWEKYQENRKTSQEPVFPWRLMIDRFVMGVLLNSFCVGATMTTVIITLPQRFQIVNGDSPLQAGYRLLALTAVTSFGSIIAGVLVQRLKIPHFWVLLGAAPLQIIGLVLLGNLSTDYAIQKETYVYQVILALGFGGTFATAMMMIPLVVSKGDVAVGMGGMGQFRALGGSLGIAISTNVINSHVSSILSNALSPSQLNSLLRSAQIVNSFPLELQVLARRAYAEAFNKSMHVTAAFGAACLLATLLLWERNPRKQE
ncbi:hypothetical protein G7Y89_g6542 [Cudoniella acicularis]|uniref:Major facilitator superfamily (MFS) profile domain-containing protein n=1 Tax=Cudoniella acicularis TaxID=354080 RepID=A0A8H4RLR3_9HELO|nr:hypothetical protein G7Y89_g6542 [Cudoniella acicularis]